MMANDEEVDVDLRPDAEAVPVVEEEQPEQLSLLSLEKSTEDLLVERVMQKGPLTTGKKEQIYEFAQTHPTGSEFTAFLKKLYGYEGFSGDEMGVKYAMFNSEGVTIEWLDKQGETQETKLSWAPGLPVSCNAWWMKAAIWNPLLSARRSSRMKCSLSVTNTVC